MERLKKLATASAFAGVLALLAWMYKAKAVSHELVDKAAVVGAIAAVLAVVLTLRWPRSRGSDPPATPVSPQRLAAAADYLATESLHDWRAQAKARRVTTPVPAAVCWQLASGDVAALPSRAESEILTEGVITRLRAELYHRAGAPDRVVLLGGAGAGKTTAMMLLLIDILQQRSPGDRQPVPVWVTLSGWNPYRTPLVNWAAASVSRDYPALTARAHGGRTAPRELIRQGHVALFLDGLDEMAPALRGPALESIDRDAAGLRVVLTSRTEEFESAVTQGRLWGAAVVELRPVDLDHVQEFLIAEQLGDRRRIWCEVTEHLAAHPAGVAARTLTSPLALSLARDVYRRSDPADLLDATRYDSTDALLRHLLARSLELAYPSIPDREHATGWLAWIARHLDARRDLRWWEIPGWMASRWPHLELWAGLAAGLVAGPAAGLAYGLRAGLASGLIFGTWVGLVFGIGLGLLFVWEANPWTSVGLRVRDGVFGDSLAVSMRHRHWAGPGELYRADRRRTLRVAMVGLAFGLVPGAALFALGAGLAASLVTGLFLCLDGVLVCGRGPALDLMTMELVWRLRGRPVRVLDLLQTALDKQVLRQVGAIYQFRHAALQDFLAEQSREIKTDRAHPDPALAPRHSRTED
jgi:hypothetical protein